MDNTLLIQYWTIDILSFLVILIPFIYIIRAKKTFSKGLVFYKWSIIFLTILILTDALSWSFNGRGSAYYYPNLIVTTLQFIIEPVFYAFWLLYSLRICNINNKKYDFIFFIPGIITTIIMIVNMFVPNFIFSVTRDTGLYVRGNYVWLYTVCASCELVPTIIYLIVQHKDINIKSFFGLLMMYLSVIVASIIQMVFKTGLDIIFPTAALCILFTYIFIVNKTLEKDPLTGLNNRLQLEEYLSVIAKLKKKNDFIIGLMLDLNHFKSVNDQFGHKEGDIALQKASKILQDSIGKNDFFLARYAGDEFVIIIPTNNPQDGVDLIEKIKTNEDIVNKQNTKYKLDFAIGEIVFDTKTDFDETAFMDAIDNDMYDKKSR